MSKKNKKKNKNKVSDGNEPKTEIVKVKNGMENGFDEVSNEDKPNEKSKSCDLCEISGAGTNVKNEIEQAEKLKSHKMKEA